MWAEWVSRGLPESTVGWANGSLLALTMSLAVNREPVRHNPHSIIANRRELASGAWRIIPEKYAGRSLACPAAW
jgi:hypothetical protein